MKKIKVLTVSILLVICFPVFAFDGESIMQKVLQAFYYQGHDQRAYAHMEITDKQGRIRIREFISLRLNIDNDIGRQKFYLYFNKPSDVKKMVFMAWKNIIQEDDRWLYLPALDLVKRIAASDDRSSFVGSNFFYEDVSGRSLNEDSHQLARVTEQYYIIDSKPRNPKSVEFTHYRVWVNKSSFLPTKIDYYDKEIMYRRYQTLETKNIDSYETVIKAKMTDKRTGSNTVIHYTDVKYFQNIPDKIFSERYLRKTPKKYFK